MSQVNVLDTGAAYSLMQTPDGEIPIIAELEMDKLLWA